MALVSIKCGGGNVGQLRRCLTDVLVDGVQEGEPPLPCLPLHQQQRSAAQRSGNFFFYSCCCFDSQL